MGEVLPAPRVAQGEQSEEPDVAQLPRSPRGFIPKQCLGVRKLSRGGGKRSGEVIDESAGRGGPGEEIGLTARFGNRSCLLAELSCPRQAASALTGHQHGLLCDGAPEPAALAGSQREQ